MNPSERAQLARRAQVSEQYLYQCLTGRRDMSPEMAARIERESDGAVTRQQLRRDWREVWPELARREDARAKRKSKQKPPPQGVTDVTLGDTSAFGEPEAKEQPDKLLGLAGAAARAISGCGAANPYGLTPDALYLYESACACANKRGYVSGNDVSCLPNTPEAQQELEQHGFVKEDARGGWRLPKFGQQGAKP